MSQGLTLPLLTLEQSSVQLDQVIVKLPSYFAYITLLLFSVRLVSNGQTKILAVLILALSSYLVVMCKVKASAAE